MSGPRRYTPSKLVDYIWNDSTECASLAFGDECEPGEAAIYEHRAQPLCPNGSHEEMLASYFSNLRIWITAERGVRN